jgi:hypothetical protein
MPIESNPFQLAKPRRLLKAGNGEPYVLLDTDIGPFTMPGELVADEPNNLEFSTGFVVRLPSHCRAMMADEQADGALAPLETRRLARQELHRMFRDAPEQFADGAARIFRSQYEIPG